MTMTVRAVYEGGVLRPVEPLVLEEGEAVDVTIATPPSDPPPSEEEILQKIDASKNLRELFEIMDSLPPDVDEDYDIVKALDENRRWSSGQSPHPRDGDAP
jgi:predicted DNA-binding antitoxin AbrB/MazE fold protein